MPSNHLLKFISSLLCINYTALSQTPSVFCSGNTQSQYCVCYETSTQCKTAITNHDRTDCFWHNIHGCISITNSPTTDPTSLHPTTEAPTHNPTSNPTSNPTHHPTSYPTSQPTSHPTEPTASPTHNRISILKCSEQISGETMDSFDINWYGLIIETATDLFIDSCGSGYDTWLYFQRNNGIELIDCDDCGSCSLQTQLHITDVHKGNYTVGVGGYRGHYGRYILQITCSVLPPNMPFALKHINTTSNPTFDPTNEPTYDPTYDPTMDTYDPTVVPTSNPTVEPTYYPSLYPTPIPTERPSNSPSKKPTLDPTIYPTFVGVTSTYLTVGSRYNFDASEGELLMVNRDKEGMNSFEIALILAVSVVFIVICIMFGLKYMDKRRTDHINLDIDDTDYSEDGDDDFMKYLHGKTNSIDIDEIIERAKTNLLNVTVDENSTYLE